MKQFISTSPCPVRVKNPLSKAADIAYLRIGRKNLKIATEYYLDFGLSLLEETEHRVLFHGFNSPYPCFSIEKHHEDVLLGVGLYITSFEEFEKLKELKGAKFLQNGRFGNSSNFPIANLTDPSGLSVDAVLVSNFLENLPNTNKNQRTWNTPNQTKRINKPCPYDKGAAKIMRLGHAVFLKQEFFKNAQWYCDTFGMIPSDIQILPDSKEPVIVFLRCDLGDKLTDHHTIVIATGADDRLEHCAFELEDLDEVAKGREWLQENGWKPAWGIGRHLLGSQIFDYHRDPKGMLVEHYADGDKFDHTVPVGYHFVNRKSLYQWGQDMPESFLDSKLTLDKIFSLVKGMFNGRDIKLENLITLKKTMKISPRNWVRY
ncbi:extradiol dioxygenase [Leptospira noumeaensis]|uniref:Extradiol dioxygenase n=1 Tax=Leptospira noumeaensis TaxID=2484964 RepID=A0A4R9I648_9LEPT|nr:VOC family protein [Leptospira noumeaensis]TGK81440.1 extradiol dioxygenase [Leptospira noumeaensis]